MLRRIDSFLDFNFLVAPLVIIILVFAVYVFSVPNAFVLDDVSQVGGNANIISFNIPKLFLGSTFGVAGTTKAEGVYYKPLMTTSYAIIFKVFGGSSAPFHLFQIILHIINTILVFYIFKKFFTSKLSLFLALIFGIHPFNSESVLYISALQEPLFFVFGALGFLFATKKRLTKTDYMLTASFMFLALLSKEAGILFIIAAIFYRLTFMREKSTLIGVLESYVPVFILYFLLRFSAVGIMPTSTDNPYPIMRLTPFQRLLNVPAETFYYLRNFFFPYDFAVGQHWTISAITPLSFYLPLGACLLFLFIIAASLTYLYKEKSHLFLSLGFFAAWFIVGMVLHLNIIPLDATVADRWFYFPIVGLLGMIGVMITKFKFEKTVLFSVAAAVIILLLAGRTIYRDFEWRSGLILALHDIKFSQDSFPLENNLGFELINVGRYNEAEAHIKRSTELGPWWWLNWNNLGVVYRHKGYTQNPKYYKDAEQAFLRAVNNTNTFYLPYENLAELLFNYDSPQTSQKFIIDTSKRMPLSGRLWFYLSLTQLKLKDTKGALQAANQAKAALPYDPQISALYSAIVNNKTIEIQRPAY